MLVTLPGALVPSQVLALDCEQEHCFVRRAGGLNYQRLQAESACVAPGKPMAPLPGL